MTKQLPLLASLLGKCLYLCIETYKDVASAAVGNGGKPETT